MKQPSENYKAVSCIVVLVLAGALVFLTIAGLSHAFNTAAVSPVSVSDDQAYVDGISHTGADQ